jgi:hypothetical protein
MHIKSASDLGKATHIRDHKDTIIKPLLSQKSKHKHTQTSNTEKKLTGHTHAQTIQTQSKKSGTRYINNEILENHHHVFRQLQQHILYYYITHYKKTHIQTNTYHTASKDPLKQKAKK